MLLRRSLLLVALFGLAACASTDNDPIEPVNRVIFNANEAADHLVVRPVAEIYRGGLPQGVQDGVQSFFRNLRSPIIALNQLLQGDGSGAWNTTKRFFVNSTVGALGVGDVAGELGMPYQNEDFGQTLASWGVGEGPYIVLPLFGPSNLRDAIGMGVDMFADPLRLHLDNIDRNEISLARGVISGIDTRSRLIEAVDDLRKNSLDYYASARSVYRQNRENEIMNKKTDSKLAPKATDFE